MADPTVPVEGNSGILDNVGTFLSDAVESVGQKALDVGSEVTQFAKDVGSEISDSAKKMKEGTFNYVSPLFDEETRKQIQISSPIDVEEKKTGREIGNEFRNVGGLNQTWDLIKGVWKMGSDKVKGTDLSGRLIEGVDEKTFNEDLSKMNEDVMNDQKIINDIATSDPKFKLYRDFNQETKNEFMKMKGSSTIEDQNEYALFLQGKFTSLTPQDQIMIQEQERLLGEKTLGLQDSINGKQQAIKTFLNTNIKPDSDKTGEQIFQDLQKEGEDFMKDNKFFSLTQKVHNIATERMNKDLAKDADVIAGVSSNFSEVKDAALDSLAADTQFYYTILAMDNLPQNEKLADKFKEGADARYRYKLEHIRTFAQMENSPELKGLSNVEKNEKIMEVAYSRLSNDDKKKYAENEGIVNGIYGLQEMESFKDRASKLNPMAVLDAAGVMGSTFQGWMDRIYEHIPGEVPNYIKQDNRALLYANEGMLKKGASMLAYNTDAIISMVAATQGVGLVLSGLNKSALLLSKSAQVIAKATPGLTKVETLVVPLRWGFTESTLKMVPTILKGATESMVTGAAADPIIDSVMVQAPDETNEAFNNITGLLFDSTLYGGGKGVVWGFGKTLETYNKTSNALMWEFLKTEDKSLVDEMIPFLNVKGKEIKGYVPLNLDTEGRTKALALMNSGVDILKKSYDPKEVDRIFSKPGELFNFIKTNVEGLDKNGLDEILTPNGLHIKKKNLFGLSSDTLNDLTGASDLYQNILNKKDSSITDQDLKMKNLVRLHIETELNKVDNLMTRTNAYNGINIKSESNLKKEGILDQYNADRASISAKIKLAKQILPSKEFESEEKREVLNQIDRGLYQFQRNYAVNKTEHLIQITDVNDSKKSFSIKFQDLQTLDGLKDMNLLDMINATGAEGKNRFDVQDNNAILAKGSYQFNLMQKPTADSHIQKLFRKEFEQVINDFGFKRGLSDSDIKQIKDGTTSFLKGGLIKFDYLMKINDFAKVKKETKELGEMLNGFLKKLIGEEYVGHDMYINDIKGLKLIKDKEKQFLYQGGDIIDHASKQDGYFNIAYGNFHSTEKDIEPNIFTGGFYITFGKEISEHSEFDEMLSGKDIKLKEGKENDYRGVGTYARYAQQIMSNIIQYGLDEKTGVINITKGIDKARVIASVVDVKGLFKDGKMLKTSVDTIVQNTLKGSDSVTDELKQFIFDVFKDTDESQGPIVVAMIKNLAIQYEQNKPLIDKLYSVFAKGGGVISSEKYIAAFSDIILHPSMFSKISERLEKYIPKNKDFTDSIKLNFQNDWKEYVERLTIVRKKLEMKLENVNEFSKTPMSYEMKDSVMESIKSIKEDISKLEKKINSSRNYDAFIKDKENTFYTSANLAVLEAHAKNYALTSMMSGKLATAGDTLYVDIHKKTIKSLQDQLLDATKTQKEIGKLTDSEKQVINDYLIKLQDKNLSFDDQQKLIDQKFDGYSTEFDSAIEYVKNIINDPRLQFNIIDAKEIEKMRNNFYEGVYSYSYIMDKDTNPMKKHIMADINNSNTGKNPGMSEKWLESFRFTEDDGVKTLDDMYHSKLSDRTISINGKSLSFKDMVDDLIAKDENNIIKFKDSYLYKFIAATFGGEKSPVKMRLSDEEFAILKKTDPTATQDVTAKALEYALKDEQILNAFKSIAFRQKLYKVPTSKGVVEKQMDIIMKKVKVVEWMPSGDKFVQKYVDGYRPYTPIYKKDMETGKITEDYSAAKSNKHSEYTEQILQLNNMVETGMDVRFIRGMKAKDITQIKVPVEIKNENGTFSTRMTKISSLLRTEGEYSTSKSALQLIRDLAANPNEDHIVTVGNKQIKILHKTMGEYGGKVSEQKTKSLKYSLESQLGIPEGYYFMGNFGDKDTTFTIYQPNDAIKIANINPADKQKIAEKIFDYEYALSNSYFTVPVDSKGKDYKKYVTAKLLQIAPASDPIKSLSDFEKRISDFEDSVKKYYGNENVINDPQIIKKRESANMSNINTFDKIKKPLATFVLREIKETLPDELSKIIDTFRSKDFDEADFKNLINSSFTDKQGKYRIGEYLEQIRQDYGTTDKIEIKDDSGNVTRETFVYLEKSKKFLESYINNDLHDGTSFVSKDITELRSKIKGLEEGRGQFKDHFFGDTDHGRMLGKTLFNTSKIELDGKELKDTVIIGENSLKMKGGYKKFDTPKEILINGKTYTVIGEVLGTDTSFFKNASSDSTKMEDAVTMSDSIKARLDYKYAKAIEDIQMDMIQKAYAETIGSLKNFSIKTNSYAGVQEMTQRMVSQLEEGIGTNVILGAKVDDFLKKINQIMNKPSENGQSVYVRESSFDISPEEVMMSRESIVGSQVLREIEGAKKEIDKKDISKEEKDRLKKELDDTPYVVGYRYPVPSKHNLGLYKIKWAEDMPEWTHKGKSIIDKEQVVLNPMATYIKLQADNDGDHAFFLSARDGMGNIIANSILKNDNATESSIDMILKSRVDVDGVMKDSYRNTFVIADQVEKATKSKIDLIEGRFIGLEAKESVGIISAFIRTIGTLKFMNKEYQDLLSKDKDLAKKYLDRIVINPKQDFMVKKGESNDPITLREVLDQFGDSFDKLDSEYYGKGFDSYTDSILQLALDFANSGASEFPKDWPDRLLGKLGLSSELFENIISPLSMGYKGFEFGSNNIENLKRVFMKENPSARDLKEYANMNPVTGSKRNIIEKTIEKYGKDISIIKKSFELEFLIDTLAAQTQDKVLAGVSKLIRDTDQYKQLGNLFFEKKGNITGLIDIYEKVKELILTGSPALVKEFQNMDKVFKDVGSMTKKNKELAKEALYKRLREPGLLQPEERITLAIYGYLNNDYYIQNLLSDEETVKYFIKSTTSLQDKINQIGKVYNSDGTEITLETKKGISLKEYNETELGIQLENLLKEFELASDPEKKLITPIIDKVQAEIDILNMAEQEVKNLGESIHENIQANDTDMLPKSEAYNFPVISWNKIDRSPQAINEIFDLHKNFSSTVKDGLIVTMSGFFKRYAPEFLLRYESIRSYLANAKMKESNRYSVMNMSDQFFAPKDTIFKQIKNHGFTSEITEDIIRKLERSLLLSDEGKFSVNDIEIAIKNMEIMFRDKQYKTDRGSVINLINTDLFKKKLIDYQNNVIVHVANNLNKLQELLGVDIKKQYGKTDFSIVQDTLEAYKSDAQLALKLSGIQNKEEFFDYIENNAQQLGRSILPAHKRMMSRVVFKDTPGAIDKVLGFVQGFHHQMSYGTMATWLTQNNLVAGMSQVIPNYVELRSQIMRDPAKLVEAMRILQERKFGFAEDVLEFGSGHSMNLNESKFSQFTSGLTVRVTGAVAGMFSKNPKTVELATKTVDSFLNNILGFNDMPLEKLRKVSSIITVMHKMGFQNKAQLDDFFEESGEQAVRGFEMHMIAEFANSGGGVVSGSPIARSTMLQYADEYIPGFISHFVVKSFGYLMGWSYHKAANFTEKETALLTGLKMLKNGDVEGFKVHLDDFIKYNEMIAKQLALSLGVYLKFQKFEKDNEDRMTFTTFARSFSNNVVAMEILFRRHITAAETADKMGATGLEKAQYTTFTIVERMFRLFKQPQFVSTMYQHYRVEEALGHEPDLVGALQYAMDTHYSSFSVFQGINAINDTYNTLGSKGNLGVLGTGGGTHEDEIMGNLWNNRDFAKWKNEGSIMKFVSTFSNLFKTQDSPLGFQVTIDTAKSIQKLIMEDPELSQLTRGGQIGTYKGDYNLATLIGKAGRPLSPSEQLAMTKVWEQASYASYRDLDDKGNRIKKTGEAIDESKMQDLLESQITKELSKNGITMEDLIKDRPDYAANVLKIMAVLNTKSNVKTPLVIYTVMAMQEKQALKMAKETLGKKTGEKSSYDGKDYTSIDESDLAKIRRDILLKNQELLNLDNSIVGSIIEQHIRKNHNNVFQKFDDVSNLKGIEDEVINLVRTQYLVSNIIKTEKDTTSVTKLQSRYATALKGLNVGTPAGVDVALQFLNDIQNNPMIDNKVKLSHQAAVLYGLNKSQYNILKDNDKFQELTQDSQKQLTNWMYKVSSDTLDYDSKSYIAGINKAATSSEATKKFYPNFKSKAMSGQRPGFSDQFQPVRDFLPGKQQYITKDPTDYLQRIAEAAPQGFQINNLKFPIMQEYTRLLIENTYYGYKSKGIVPSYVVEPKIDVKQKKYINLKKPAKAQGKQKGGAKKSFPKKVSGGAWAGLPGSNIQD